MEIKEQLLTTAIELFKKEGYQNVTVQSICDACHVTKGSFYYHYRYKEDLLMDYYHITSEGELTEVLADILVLPDSLQKLWRLFQFYIDSSTRLGADLLKNLMKINLDNDGKIYPMVREKIMQSNPDFLKIYYALMAEGQKSGSIREGDADQMLTLYMTGFVGALTDWSATGGEGSAEEVLYEIFLRIYQVE
jgi:AcrR family transcriptional regulator